LLGSQKFAYSALVGYTGDILHNVDYLLDMRR
jgi:hypothetical protein